jgi:hypothetical protein
MQQTFNVHRGYSAVWLAAMLAGCGGSPFGAQSASTAIAPQAQSRPPEGRSWMNPAAAGQDLLYVVNNGDENVYVYSYPQGQLVGTLTGFIAPTGECVDTAGDIFIVAASNKERSSGIIYEYAHGGTSPMATLTDPNPAFGCAVDGGSGNLAVSGGGVAIYKHASGEPVMYSSSQFAFYFCGYDSNGNLYLSASNGNYLDQEQFVRLAKGSSAFQQISVDTTLYAVNSLPSSVQWDGKHMTVSSGSASIGQGYDGPLYLYRLSISGGSATVVGTTTLSSKKNRTKSGQIWIQGVRVIGSDYFRGHGGIDSWSYPDARKPQTVVTPNKQSPYPFGIVVSPAASL